MSEFYVNWAKVKFKGCIQSYMLPWKLRNRQILPVNKHLLSVYFSLAKFQLVSCDIALDMIWQMTYTHKLPKQCSATLNNCPDMSASCLLGSQSEHRIRWLVETQYPLWFFVSAPKLSGSIRYIVWAKLNKVARTQSHPQSGRPHPPPPPPTQPRLVFNVLFKDLGQ